MKKKKVLGGVLFIVCIFVLILLVEFFMTTRKTKDQIRPPFHTIDEWLSSESVHVLSYYPEGGSFSENTIRLSGRIPEYGQRVCIDLLSNSDFYETDRSVMKTMNSEIYLRKYLRLYYYDEEYYAEKKNSFDEIYVYIFDGSIFLVDDEYKKYYRCDDSLVSEILWSFIFNSTGRYAIDSNGNEIIYNQKIGFKDFDYGYNSDGYFLNEEECWMIWGNNERKLTRVIDQTTERYKDIYHTEEATILKGKLLSGENVIAHVLDIYTIIIFDDDSFLIYE